MAAGASFTDFAGWQMPVRYSSDLAEHHAVRTAAGLFDLSHMAEIRVTGPDAAACLDHALAGLLSATVVGQAKYSLLLAESGGVIDDVVVYRLGDQEFLVVANASNREPVAAALAERAAGFDAEVVDESDDVALIAVQGPAAREVLERTEGLDAPGNRRAALLPSLPGLLRGRAGAARPHRIHRRGRLRAVPRPDEGGGPLGRADGRRRAARARAGGPGEPRHAAARGRHAPLRP